MQRAGVQRRSSHAPPTRVVYNSDVSFLQLSDFEKFGKALKEVCFEIVEELDKAKGMQQITKS